MARAKAKSSSQRARHESEIRRLVILDTLRGLAVPGVAMAGVLVLWVLCNAGLLDVGPALTATSLLVLFMVAHFGLRDFLHEQTPVIVAVGVAVFACAWMAGLGWPLHATITPPPPLFVGELRAGAPASTVPLNATPGQYRVVVSGHLPAAADKASHGGTYRLHVKDDDGLDQVVAGTFSESWQRKRLGRRGGVPVRVAHSVAQHRIQSGSGHDLNIALLELTGDVGSSVGIEVFKQAVSRALLTTIGVVLTTAALIVDAWRTDVTHEGLMTIETLAALGGVIAFRAFGAAHAGFGDLFVNGVMGAVPGAAVGAILWRVAGAPVRKLLRSAK